MNESSGFANYRSVQYFVHRKDEKKFNNWFYMACYCSIDIVIYEEILKSEGGKRLKL